jgi:hypothetical protein
VVPVAVPVMVVEEVLVVIELTLELLGLIHRQSLNSQYLREPHTRLQLGQEALAVQATQMAVLVQTQYFQALHLSAVARVLVM